MVVYLVARLEFVDDCGGFYGRCGVHYCDLISFACNQHGFEICNVDVASRRLHSRVSIL